MLSVVAMRKKIMGISKKLVELYSSTFFHGQIQFDFFKVRPMNILSVFKREARELKFVLDQKLPTFSCWYQYTRFLPYCASHTDIVVPIRTGTRARSDL